MDILFIYDTKEEIKNAMKLCRAIFPANSIKRDVIAPTGIIETNELFLQFIVTDTLMCASKGRYYDNIISFSSKKIDIMKDTVGMFPLNIVEK